MNGTVQRSRGHQCDPICEEDRLPAAALRGRESVARSRGHGHAVVLLAGKRSAVVADPTFAGQTRTTSSATYLDCSSEAHTQV